MQITTVTQKGQVTIPVDIRRFLQIDTGDQVAFIKTKDQVVLKPARSFLDLKGSIKKSRKFSDKDADKAILDLASKTYAQKTTRS